MILISFFLFFSILGFSIEYVISLICRYKKETLLVGPWMPIYGIGFLTIHLVHFLLKKKNLSSLKEKILFFILSVIFLSIIEEIGGLLTQEIFHQNFWSYEGFPLSIGPYINVFVSLLWGVIALICEYLIYPKLTPLLKKIPKQIIYILLFLLILDHIICLKNAFSL